MFGSDHEICSVIVGCPVAQASAGLPIFSGRDDADLFAERQNPHERIGAFATQFAEVPNGSSEKILQLCETFIRRNSGGRRGGSVPPPAGATGPRRA